MSPRNGSPSPFARFLPMNVLHYVRYRLGIDEAQTQTTEAERALLQRLAPGRKVIVELGMFEGVSSLAVRTAMDHDAELYCVDPFPTGRLLFSPQQGISQREIGKSRNGKVHLLQLHSHEAIERWTRAIDLLFLDGDHSFEAASRDFREWGRFVARGGLILIHTSRSAGKYVPDDCGQARLVREVVANDPGFRIDSYVESVTIVEKL